MKVDKSTIGATIRQLHSQGVVTDALIAARLNVNHRTIAHYRTLHGIPPAPKRAVAFDRRYGPGAYALLRTLFCLDVPDVAIAGHFGFSREWAGVLRLRLTGSGRRGRTRYCTGGVQVAVGKQPR